MSDEIVTKSGLKVASWNGVDVKDLQTELERVRKELRAAGSEERLYPGGVPHRDQLAEDLHKFTAYLIWGQDQNNNCLCGARANRIVSVDDVRQYSLVEHH